MGIGGAGRCHRSQDRCRAVWVGAASRERGRDPTGTCVPGCDQGSKHCVQHVRRPPLGNLAAEVDGWAAPGSQGRRMTLTKARHLVGGWTGVPGKEPAGAGLGVLERGQLGTVVFEPIFRKELRIAALIWAVGGHWHLGAQSVEVRTEEQSTRGWGEGRAPAAPPRTCGAGGRSRGPARSVAQGHEAEASGGGAVGARGARAQGPVVETAAEPDGHVVWK